MTVSPPSTTSSVPVMYLASSEARKSAAYATSQASPMCPIGHVERLRRAELDDLAIADVIHAAAFFNWANRLMLSLGEPAAPTGA